VSGANWNNNNQEMHVENALHRCNKFGGNERPTLMQIYDALHHRNVLNFMYSTAKLQLFLKASIKIENN
jgi:hypothetical protein